MALLQEVPPWWPPALAEACGASFAAVRTSRNALLPVRRAVASRNPDLLGANGGGAVEQQIQPAGVQLGAGEKVGGCGH